MMLEGSRHFNPVEYGVHVPYLFAQRCDGKPSQVLHDSYHALSEAPAVEFVRLPLSQQVRLFELRVFLHHVT